MQSFSATYIDRQTINRFSELRPLFKQVEVLTAAVAFSPGTACSMETVVAGLAGDGPDSGESASGSTWVSFDELVFCLSSSLRTMRTQRERESEGSILVQLLI